MTMGAILKNNAIAGNKSRTIDYLRISITDRCNSRCIYCLPPGGVQRREERDLLSFEEIVSFTNAAVATGVSRVRITGGEPLVRPGSAELIGRLAGIEGIRDLSLTTNGSLLSRHASGLKAAGLSRINISIDSLSPERFSQLTGGANLGPVLDGLESVLAAGFAPVKVNAVSLPGIEDDLDEFVKLARELPVHVRFIEFMPIGKRVGGLWKFVSRKRLLQKLQGYGRLKPVASPGGAGPARYFQFDGARGTIGFISSMSDHFCAGCNRLRLTADGYLRNCLFSEEEIFVKPYFAGGRGALSRVILDSMNSKKFDRRIVNPGERTMSQIGG